LNRCTNFSPFWISPSSSNRLRSASANPGFPEPNSDPLSVSGRLLNEASELTGLGINHHSAKAIGG
jgi:hypothetical protein